MWKTGGRWQIDSKTERLLLCLLAKVTWQINNNLTYGNKYNTCYAQLVYSYLLANLAKTKGGRGVASGKFGVEVKMSKNFRNMRV